MARVADTTSQNMALHTDHQAMVRPKRDMRALWGTGERVKSGSELRGCEIFAMANSFSLGLGLNPLLSHY